MKTRNFVGIGIAAAMLIAPIASFAADVRDPGRLPRADKARDKPASPTATVTTQTTINGNTAQSGDVRDPGSAKVPDKSRDGVRRR
ncbi:MAG: hypothetical protein ACKVOS_10375 [Sphingorhabdus sp.]|uniref:hypothetical protein n=1 Tax=Sphingorhabdus sp. TaxID=1902408 RepID=UPI0038FC38CD